MVRRRYRAPILALILALCAAAWACNRRDDLDGQRRTQPPAPQAERPPRSDRQPAFSLIDNRGAMVLTRGGRMTLSGHGARIVPYIDGDLRSEWRTSAMVDGEAGAMISGRIANLFVPLDRDAHGVLETAEPSLILSLRFRPSTKAQVASVFVNEQPVGDVRFADPVWQTRSVSVPVELCKSGENRVRFFFRHLADGGEHSGSPGVLGWMRIGAKGPESEPEVRVEGTPGGVRSLRSPAGARLSFFAAVPGPDTDPTLRLKLAGQGAAAVSIALSSGRYRELWSGAAGPAEEIAISLQELADEIVRIDLYSAGDALWTDPVIDSKRVAASEPEDLARADHIIVWAVSSLRADRIGDRTSHLAAFRRQAAHFPSAWSPGPVAGVAHSAVLTGRPHTSGRIDAGDPALAELLRREGYATALVSGNGFINDSAGFARGFDLYQNPMRLSRPHSARVLWQAARRFLLRHRQHKTFVYIATSEPHLPYRPSDDSLSAEWGSQAQPLAPASTAALSVSTQEDGKELPSAQRDFVVALYNAAVRDADVAFGAMLESLRELELQGTTAIIVLGDHGEALFEEGFFGHGRGLADELVHVPLMISAEGVAPGPRPRPATLADLFPTILSLAAVEAPASSGRSLLGPAARAHSRSIIVRNAQGDWAIRLGKHKLVIPKGQEAQLLDLTSGDRGHDLSDERPVAARYLRAALSYAVAFDRVWVEARWGQVDNHSAGFPADQGL